MLRNPKCKGLETSHNPSLNDASGGSGCSYSLCSSKNQPNARGTRLFQENPKHPTHQELQRPTYRFLWNGRLLDARPIMAQPSSARAHSPGLRSQLSPSLIFADGRVRTNPTFGAAEYSRSAEKIRRRSQRNSASGNDENRDLDPVQTHVHCAIPAAILDSIGLGTT